MEAGLRGELGVVSVPKAADPEGKNDTAIVLSLSLNMAEMIVKGWIMTTPKSAATKRRNVAN